jgi:hypothetical protein
LIRRKHAFAGIGADAVERGDGLVLADDGTPAPQFLGPVFFLNGAGADDRIIRAADTPAAGDAARSASYSEALFALNGNWRASASVPTIFAVRSSEESSSGFGEAGPAIVARLFGSISGATSAGFFDLDMDSHSRS